MSAATTSKLAPPPAELESDKVVLEARGTIIGQSSSTTVDRIAYVVPAAYAELTLQDRFSVARLIGRLTHASPEADTLMLVGPGRWGTSTPSLGVPVSFAEINTVSILCEIVSMGDHVTPDVSLGTHFFNDLVEANMLYLAVYPTRPGNAVNEAFFERQPNRLADLLPDDARWAGVVRVVDLDPARGSPVLRFYADCLTQTALCYLDRPHPAGSGPASA